MAGYKYEWKCPKCGTSLQLKMRVTQSKRKCPHCGMAVTPKEIDKQAKLNAIGGFIASLTMVAAILFCCKGCPNNSSQISKESATTVKTTSETTSTTTNSDTNLTTITQKSVETEILIDLSNPKDAFLSHVRAMKNRDIDRYIETLSQKKIKDDLSGILSKDANGKKRNSIREIVIYWFSIWDCRLCSSPDILKYGFDLIGNPQIRGTKSTVWYRDNGSGNFMVARLTKEGANWKIDTYLDFPKKWEEKEFFKNTDLGNRP